MKQEGAHTFSELPPTPRRGTVTFSPPSVKTFFPEEGPAGRSVPGTEVSHGRCLHTPTQAAVRSARPLISRTRARLLPVPKAASSQTIRLVSDHTLWCCACLSIPRVECSNSIPGKQTLGQEYCGIGLTAPGGESGRGSSSLSETPLRVYTFLRVGVPYLQVGQTVTMAGPCLDSVHFPSCWWSHCCRVRRASIPTSSHQPQHGTTQVCPGLLAC